MSRPLHQKLNNSRGFTLAETLVALAIIIVLLGISMLGIISYVKNMKLTEMDSTARQIFVAAQNHLTSAEVTGRLDNAGDLGLSMSKPADFPDTADDPKWPGNNNGEYYYIAYSPTDSTSLESSILKDMLPFGAIDETVRKDGSYIIEYNIKTASVYGVFYTDNEAGVNSVDVASLNTTGGRSETLGRIVRRDYEKDNKRVTIGYYGGAMAQELEGEQTDTPFFEIDNGERLLLKINDTNYFRKSGGKQLQTQLTVKVTGEESKKVKTFDLKLSGGPTMPGQDSTAADKERWKVETKTTEKGDKYLAYEICLDDITTFGGHFVKVCEGFTPGEDVSIDVQCKSSTVATFEMNAQGKTNSLFATSKTTTEGGRDFRNVEIGAIRHFENLEKKISNIETNWQKTHVKTASQINDLDWSVFHKDKNIYPHNSLSETNVLAKNSLYGISVTTLTEYNGNGKTMKDFVFRTEETDGESKAGLFQSVKPARELGGTMAISNLKLEDFDVNAQGTSTSYAYTLSAGALVANIEVPGGGMVNISNVVAVNGKVASKSNSAGGLIGSINESYGPGNVTISDCAAVARVSGNGGYPGGFIGRIQGGTITVNNSYSSGRTKDGVYSSSEYDVTSNRYSSGGFIGAADGGNVIATNCYSTSSVDAGGNQAGGFIGSDTSYNSKYDNCYATGLVKYYGHNEGAFAYSLGATANNVTNCRYLKSINGDMKGVDAWVNPGPGIKGVSYSELAKNVDNSKGETYAFDKPFYEGIIYPFPMVTKVGAIDLLNATGVHYGDWPKNDEIELINPTEVMFAYREGGMNSAADWYVKAVAKDGTIGVAHNSFPDGYVESMKPRPTGGYGEYGLLIPKNFLNNNDFSGGNASAFPSTYSGVLLINGEEYYFWPLVTKADPGTGTIPLWTNEYKGANGYPKVSFSFTPGYAATIGAIIHK